MNCLWNQKTRAVIVLFCVSIASHSILASDDAAKDKGKESAKSEVSGKPDMKEAKTDEGDDAVKLPGTFEAAQSWELSHGLDQVGDLEIKKILPHGAEVKKGQAVVWFDPEAIDEKISATEIEVRLARIAAEDEQFSYDQFIASQQLDRQDAEQARKAAKQAFDNYMQLDRDRKIESAEFDMEMSKASLENAEEELKQLQQMYDADDLTEQSEEIVLKRAKRSVESAQFRLESTETRSERTINQSIPADDVRTEAAFERAEMAYEKAIRDLESAKKKRDLERQKAANALAEKEADFKTLRDQRKSIVIKAPGDGILLYGQLNRGALSAKPSPMEAGSKVSPDQVIATLVHSGKMTVRLTLNESDLGDLKVGDQCVVLPAIDPAAKVKGILDSIASVPFMGTNFDAKVKVVGELPVAVKPTMTATVEVSK